MATITKYVDVIRQGLKNQSALLVKPFGLTLLTKTRTEQYLEPFRVGLNRGIPVDLPGTDAAHMDGRVFGKTQVTTPDTYVWQVEQSSEKVAQLRSGIVQIGGNVLDTDFGTSALFKTILNPKKRVDYDAQTLIAPWSHYWGGYFDYLLFVAAKLCRMKDAMPPARFAESVVAYPLLNTAFERELLALIGIRPDHVVDSRTHAVRFDACVLGNTGSWFYPNRADVTSLRNHISSQMPVQATSPERIYISRAGRRRVVNEAPLVRMLEGYGFTIVEDRPRSIADQYALYHNASFIIGPHGASFANVIWSKPGAHLFELFAPDYAPDYFRYLAHVTGLNYHAYCHEPVRGSRHSYVDQNVYVSIGQVDRQLSEIFSKTAFNTVLST